LVTRYFWWPGITKEVKKYIESCDICQRNKNCTEALAGKLMPNAVPEKPWSYITADFITKLPLAQGYDVILVVCDRMTKMAHFMPTIERTLAKGVVRLFQDTVWKLHRLPKSIIIDRGAQFAAEMMRELNQMLGINTKLSTAYHLQTDSQMVSQLYYRPVVIYCMVYHYTKRATLARLLANEGLAIYVVL